MTYQELKKITEGQTMPLVGKNADGENVIIQHMTDQWTYSEVKWERNYFKLTTAQNNGWIRHNYIYEDGSREEFFTK